MKALKLIFFQLFILTVIIVSGSSDINSLRGLLKTTLHDTVQIKALLDIGNFYRATNQDSGLFYYQKAFNLARSSGNSLYIALSLKSIGIIHDIRHEYSEALDFYEQSKRVYIEIGDKNGIAACTFNTGLIFYNQGNYPDAVLLFEQALQIYTGLNDKDGIARCLNNIGNVNYMQGEYPKAIESYRKSLK